MNKNEVAFSSNLFVSARRYSPLPLHFFAHISLQISRSKQIYIPYIRLLLQSNCGCKHSVTLPMTHSRKKLDKWYAFDIQVRVRSILTLNWLKNHWNNKKLFSFFFCFSFKNNRKGSNKWEKIKLIIILNKMNLEKFNF